MPLGLGLCFFSKAPQIPGPDGKLYISNFGFGFPAGAGQIVRITPED
jgi:hypothetical protein